MTEILRVERLVRNVIVRSEMVTCEGDGNHFPY